MLTSVTGEPSSWYISPVSWLRWHACTVKSEGIRLPFLPLCGLAGPGAHSTCNLWPSHGTAVQSFIPLYSSHYSQQCAGVLATAYPCHLQNVFRPLDSAIITLLCASLRWANTYAQQHGRNWVPHCIASLQSAPFLAAKWNSTEMEGLALHFWRWHSPWCRVWNI